MAMIVRFSHPGAWLPGCPGTQTQCRASAWLAVTVRLSLPIVIGRLAQGRPVSVSHARTRWVTGCPLVAGSGENVLSTDGVCVLVTTMLAVSTTVRGSTSRRFIAPASYAATRFACTVPFQADVTATC